MTALHRRLLLGLFVAACTIAATARPALVTFRDEGVQATSLADDGRGLAALPGAGAVTGAATPSPASGTRPVASEAAPEAEDGFVFPVAGGTSRSVVGHFGDPRDNGRRTHLGVDIAAPIGTPVLAPVAGTVERTGSGGAGGRVVWLRDAGADRVYYFAHLDIVAVRPGQQVAAGTQLGTVGTSGNAAGTVPHLHFGVYEGRDVLDPWWFLVAGPGRAGDEMAGATRMRTRLAGAAMRPAPGRGAAVAVLPRHQAVTVLDRVDGYYRVLHNGQNGYVAAWLLEAM